MSEEVKRTKVVSEKYGIRGTVFEAYGMTVVLSFEDEGRKVEMGLPVGTSFYDLETSGLMPRADRIMQFAGQRTDMELNPIGEPENILVKMTDDALLA